MRISNHDSKYALCRGVKTAKVLYHERESSIIKALSVLKKCYDFVGIFMKNFVSVSQSHSVLL